MEPNIVAGVRGARIAASSNIAQSGVPISDMFDQSLLKEGEMFYSDRPDHWVIVRNVPETRNERGETTREGLRIECKFARGFYLLRHDDPHFAEKKKHLEKLPEYGSKIKPMSQILDANKIAARYEAIRVIANIKDGEESAGIIRQLLPNLDISQENREIIESILTVNPEDVSSEE